MFDVNYFINVIPKLLSFFPQTLLITGISTLFGLFFGLIIVILKLGKNKAAKNLALGYTAVIRGTPVLLQLFLIYYGVPPLLAAVGIDINNMSKTTFAIITFAMNNAAYFSEDMKAAFLSVDGGQMEAALSVGMSGPAGLLRIVLPQTATVFMPNLGNNIAALLKDTSIVFTIGILDLIGGGNILSGLNYGANRLEIYIGVSLIYWLSVIVIDKGIYLFEQKHAKSRKGMDVNAF
jgi:L-cystine transport system permease protein